MWEHAFGSSDFKYAFIDADEIVDVAFWTALYLLCLGMGIMQIRILCRQQNPVTKPDNDYVASLNFLANDTVCHFCIFAGILHYLQQNPSSSISAPSSFQMFYSAWFFIGRALQCAEKALEKIINIRLMCAIGIWTNIWGYFFMLSEFGYYRIPVAV